MSAPGEGEIIEVLYWHYPDRIDKMIMNDLVNRDTMSKRDFKDLINNEFIEQILDMFEQAGYVTTGMAVHPSDGVTYKTWTTTPFFKSRIKWQKDLQAENDVIKMALWNQRNQLLLSAHKARLSKFHGPSLAAAAVAGAAQDEMVMDDDIAAINDRIQPELEELKRKMLADLDEEKRRVKREQEEEEEEGNEEAPHL